MVGTRFAVATHILVFLATKPTPGESTSLRLAESINTNPVVVRRIAGQLARAGLIRIRRGPGGSELAREPDAITLEDVWRAVQSANRAALLPVHPRPDPDCPVGRNIRPILSSAFAQAETALHQSLAGISLAALAREIAAGVN